MHKITVRIQVTTPDKYSTRDVALASVEVAVPGDFTYSAVRRALDELTDDVTARVGEQLRAEGKRLAALAGGDDD
jgi:hypothetical protein